MKHRIVVIGGSHFQTNICLPGYRQKSVSSSIEGLRCFHETLNLWIIHCDLSWNPTLVRQSLSRRRLLLPHARPTPELVPLGRRERVRDTCFKSPVKSPRAIRWRSHSNELGWPGERIAAQVWPVRRTTRARLISSSISSAAVPPARVRWSCSSSREGDPDGGARSTRRRRSERKFKLCNDVELLMNRRIK